MTRLIYSVILFLVLSNAFAKSTDGQTLMVVGFDGENWFPYVAKLSKNKKLVANNWIKIKSIRNPAYLTRQPKTGNIYVKGNDGRLYIYLDSRKSYAPLLKLDKNEKLNNYTQLRANEKGLVMVKLVDGKSRDTQLVYLDDIAEPINIRPVFRQASAQFHPLTSGHFLFYAHVSCRAVCSPIIQEVWQQNRVTGKAKQLTLLNATSYLHSVDEAARYGFISSNKNGYYHIAKLDLRSSDVTWLTDGQVTDSYPSASIYDEVYFIRRTPKGTDLMSINIKSDKQLPDKIPLPNGVNKIRYLELTN